MGENDHHVPVRAHDKDVDWTPLAFGRHVKLYHLSRGGGMESAVASAFYSKSYPCSDKKVYLFIYLFIYVLIYLFIYFCMYLFIY